MLRQSVSCCMWGTIVALPLQKSKFGILPVLLVMGFALLSLKRESSVVYHTGCMCGRTSAFLVLFNIPFK